jgi:hypothetical protein
MATGNIVSANIWASQLLSPFPIFEDIPAIGACPLFWETRKLVAIFPGLLAASEGVELWVLSPPTLP